MNRLPPFHLWKQNQKLHKINRPNTTLTNAPFPPTQTPERRRETRPHENRALLLLQRGRRRVPVHHQRQHDRAHAPEVQRRPLDRPRVCVDLPGRRLPSGPSQICRVTLKRQTVTSLGTLKVSSSFSSWSVRPPPPPRVALLFIRVAFRSCVLLS